MLAVSILFCNLDFIGCHVFDIRSVTYIFKVSILCTFSLFFFFLQYFLSFILCFGCISFQSFPCYSFSAAAPGISVLQGSLPARVYCPHSTTLSFRLQFLRFIDHFLLMDPMRGTFVGFGFSPILLSGSSGIAVSSCSVLALCPRFLISTCGVFNFFRFI